MRRGSSNFLELTPLHPTLRAWKKSDLFFKTNSMEEKEKDFCCACQ
jgi:hypothetical protein